VGDIVSPFTNKLLRIVMNEEYEEILALLDDYDMKYIIIESIEEIEANFVWERAFESLTEIDSCFKKNYPDG
jgi:hypothetical protein